MVDRRVALKQNFKSADMNKDGFLNYAEMEELLKRGNPKISQQSIKTCFDKVSKGDGKVSFDEFVDYICPTEGDLLKEKLPFDKSPKSMSKRKELFGLWDKNGNGILSLAEIDKGIREALGVGDIGPSGLAPVLMRAYQVARDVEGGSIDMTKVYGMKAAMDLKHADIYASTVSKKEFRVLLQYIHRYHFLYETFKTIDANFDGRVGPGEFKAFSPKLKEAGFPECSFADVDCDGQGMCLFDEFCAFMIGKKGLEFGDEE